MQYLIYFSMMFLALGLVTSTSLLGLSHVLIIVPAIFYLSKTNWKKLNTSSWWLLAMAVMIILSVFVNQDIMVEGYKPALKSKYFLIGLISIYPMSLWFYKFSNDKKISYLVYALFTATTVATIAGIVGMKTGYNYISMREVLLDRNAGLSGMVLNYAHNLAAFITIAFGFVIYRKKLSKYINMNFAYICLVINLIGIYLSYTRGALLAIIVGAPFYFFKYHKKKFILFGLAILLLAGGFYKFSGDNIIRPNSDRERLSQWRAAIKAFQERPILGYGYLNFEKYSISIKERYDIGELQFGGHAHNNFLEMLASVGLLGFICYLGWLISWFIEVYKRDDTVARICLPLIIVFLMSGLTQSTISLGVNLFFTMAVYSISQVKHFRDMVL